MTAPLAQHPDIAGQRALSHRDERRAGVSMSPRQERPGTANAGRTDKAKAANLSSYLIIDTRPRVLYQAPGEPLPILIQLGARELDMVLALDGRPLTRVELVRIRPRLGLNATGTVARLRRKGIPVESVWHKITDAEGRTVRFVSYSLTGKVWGWGP